MKRELKLFGFEPDGFKTLDDAIAFCKARPGISYAEIGYRTKYHVFTGAFDHHFQFYHKVAVYEMLPQVTYIPDNQQ